MQFAPGTLPDADSGMCIINPNVITKIPTLSEWGLLAMAGVLGIIGLLTVRRRKATV